ncbi:MAG: hypothetical protein KF901_28760 [Myxococcales bacterium]|nr:hypothetical protein [Myxococcales bacterium]
MTRLGVALAALAMVWGSAPRSAHAGGLEFPAPGTTALGRGGATFARPGDPMALFYNPANLAGMQGIQLSLQSHLAFYGACIEREGTYESYGGASAPHDRLRRERDDDGEPVPPFLAPANRTIPSGLANAADFSAYEGTYRGDAPFPRVCNSAPPGIVPELVLTWRVNRFLGLGVGLLAPAAVGNTRWGNTMRIGDREVVGTVDGLPAPTRYMLIEESLIVAFPTIGVGVAPHKRFRLGLAFGSGFGIISFDSIVRPTRGEDFGGDVLSELRVRDRFIPRITASAQVVPHDNLDISLSFIWTDKIRAEGDVSLTSGYYQTDVVDQLTISGVRLEAAQPWQLALGIRYADQIRPRADNPDAVARLSGRVEDAMSNERWDLELNVVYERNSLVDTFGVTMPSCSDPARCGMGQYADNWMLNVGVRAPLPSSLALAHNWRDSISVRLGGDYNIIPGMAAIRLGLSFETRGVTQGYEQLDFMPFTRLGGHVGFTLRFGRFDLSLAYAFIGQFAVTNSIQDARLPQVNAAHRLADQDCDSNPACASLEGDERELAVSNGLVGGGRGTIINAGRYTSRFNVLSLGLTYHFR